VNIQTQLHRELVTAFSEGSLEALVRSPGTLENHVLPPETWKRAFFPERLFFSDAIVGGHDAYWDAAAGRTAFVRKHVFKRWLAERSQKRKDASFPADEALKEHLLGLAADGVVRSAEIEKLAAEWCLPAFARAPPPERYEVLNLGRWTLCMAVSWIVWRTHEDVRQAWDDYRAECVEWSPFSRREQIDAAWYKIDGEELTTLKPTSLSCLGIAEAANCDDRESSKRVSVKTARTDLWQKLAEGHFTAAGINQYGQLVDIAAREWAYLECAANSDGSDFLVFAHDRLTRAYSDITVPARHVRDCWPGPTNKLRALPLQKTTGTSARTGRKLLATRLAISKVYPDGVPIGLNVDRRLEQLNGWLRENGHSVVSHTTVLRALRS